MTGVDFEGARISFDMGSGVLLVAGSVGDAAAAGRLTAVKVVPPVLGGTTIVEYGKYDQAEI